MTVTLTICTTCKSAATRALNNDLRSAGMVLAEALESAALQRQTDAVTLIRHDCLWACSQACTLLIQGKARTGYLAGRFEPTEGAVTAILDWVAAYAATPDGVVSRTQNGRKV